MYDIIIVGAGPAGMSAALFAARSNKNVLLLEASSYGGQIIKAHKINNYPTLSGISGFDYAERLYNQIKDLGVEIKYEKAINIINNKDYKEVVTKKNTYKTKAIILSTGSDNRLLGIDREKEFTGKGVSYCATCDGYFFKGLNVAVVGNNNNAIEEAIYLSEIANKVYLINKDSSFKADDYLIEELNNKNNIEVIINSTIKSLNGENKLESISLNDRNLNISALFISVGRVPENENFKNLINIDKNGYIIAGEDCHTNVEGIFVAGDNRTKSLRQLVTANSDGAIAATEAIKYVNSK